MTLGNLFIGMSLFLCAGAAYAGGAPVPAPLAGAFGPAGIVVAGVAYAGYWYYKKR